MNSEFPVCRHCNGLVHSVTACEYCGEPLPETEQQRYQRVEFPLKVASAMEEQPRPSLGRPVGDPPMYLGNSPLENSDPGAGRRPYFLLLVVVLAVFSMAYRALVWHGLEQTSLLFIGLPTLMSVALSYTQRPKTLVGVVMRFICLALCLSGILLGEGFICILMASPLFFLVALLVTLPFSYLKQKKETRYFWSLLIFLPIFLTSFEGVTPKLSFHRSERVTATKVVSQGETDIRAKLASPMNFSAPLPGLFKLGFPLPQGGSGTGLEVGDERTIHFAGGEGEPGDLTLRVTHSDDHQVVFTAVSDTSHIAHWMAWETSTVSWRTAPGGGTEITWEVAYKRKLDPAWYFGPCERFAVRKAAAYLLDTLATPEP